MPPAGEVLWLTPSNYLHTQMSLNIVDLIKSQINPNTLGQLSSLLGENPEKTATATGAAAPALLAAVANLGSKPEGASQLLSTLRNVDPSIVDKFSGLLGSQGTGVAQQGTSLLSGLFGGGMVTTLAAAVSKFTGLPQGTAATLIGTLAPMVLGVLSKHTQSQGLNASSLANLLAGQKQNIASALPPGMAPLLSSVPGLQGFLGSTGETVRSAADSSRAAASDVAQATSKTVTTARSGLPGWLVPLAVVVVLALLLFQFLKPKPAAAPAETPVAAETDQTAQFTTGLNGALNNITQTLNGVHDPASANEALPKLKDASGQLDGLKSIWARLPDSAKTQIKGSVAPSLTAVQELIAKVTAIPGVGDILKPTTDGLAAKLKDLLA
jgi:hypothetical protein